MIFINDGLGKVLYKTNKNQVFVKTYNSSDLKVCNTYLHKQEYSKSRMNIAMIKLLLQ